MRILTLGLAATALMAGACAPMESADPMPSPDAPGQCKADQYQGYVGRNRSELPQAPADATWRVTCTTCPMTLDYNPRRLNILFDETTGVTRQVKCG